jgi:hypothetical protein
MTERGRKPGFKMPEEHRTKIANSKILNRLIDHVEGNCDLTSTQVTAALGLLRKVMPDMTESKSDVTVEHRSVMRMPEPAKDGAEWLKTSSGNRSQAPKPH